MKRRISWVFGRPCQEAQNLSLRVITFPTWTKIDLPKKKVSFVPLVASTDMGTKPSPSLGISAHKQAGVEAYLHSGFVMPNSILKHSLKESIKLDLLPLQIAPKYFPSGF